ncbi:hypothetical protein HPG69_001011 [Diceros bicornis minor]|uniref:Myosin binding protein H like n=1 Tax=Diceros bicornis minor TaxID=77932 RepID=A0A7J7E6L3_DICBM|nr:hypothetical protein HPG69_001011 [Diceros bicornis minor]
MEAATAPEVASGSTLKMKEASPADAERPQASPPQGAGSPVPQLLSPIEGDPWGLNLLRDAWVTCPRSTAGCGIHFSELYSSHHRRLTTPCSLSFHHSEHPKIQLPRVLRQTYIRKAGDTVNLLIPRVSVRNRERDSILFIQEAQRADSGCYQLKRPGPPQSIKLVDVWSSNATLEWTPRQDTGNAALLGYTVQKADTKSRLWFTVLEHYHRTSCTVTDLIVGNSYAFRVFAENQCGLSETAPITADLAHIQKAATVYKMEGFAQRDFSEAPKFTQSLADCTTVTSYDTQLFCCVRASPKPKIIWLKNKIDIQDNPKYGALTHLGICSLEIRKPGPFDGGIYTCKAVNPLGEASVDCRVDVKAGKVGAETQPRWRRAWFASPSGPLIAVIIAIPLKKSDSIYLIVRGCCGREVGRCCKKRCQGNNQEWKMDEVASTSWQQHGKGERKLLLSIKCFYRSIISMNKLENRVHIHHRDVDSRTHKYVHS